MAWAWIVGGVIALSLATLGVGASIAVVRSKTLGRLQKLSRLTAVWLLPLLGPMFVLHRIQETEPEAVPRELVAASGLGWGLLGDAGRRADAKTRRTDDSAGGTADSGAGGDGGDGRGGGAP